jgi:selenocysteine lyase/cysteine desulfurase
VPYDVARVRAHFPQLKKGPATGAAHFDGPGGSQTPDVVAQAMYDVLVAPLANRGDTTPAERNAEAAVVAARAAIGDLLATDPSGVVFGRSMTQLTMDLARTLAKGWGPGDEAVGATVRWVDFDPATAELGPDRVADVLTDRTRLVAFTGASNLIGTRPDVPAIAGLTHDAGALLHVDGVHYTAHVAPDVVALGADTFVCSPYKFLGPHCGVLAGRVELLETLRPDKLVPSSDAVPDRFELGTLPYELLAGTAAAVDFLADLMPGEGSRRERIVASYAALEAHEDRLRTRIEEGLVGLPGVTLHSRAARRTPTLLVTFAGHDAQDVRRHLASRNVNAPAGSFYAYEASRHLGLGTAGGLRIGLAPYNDDDDVDRLLDGLREALAGG